MRVLYYYSKLNIGGAERSTVRLLNRMADSGHSVTLLLRWGGGNLEGDLDRRIQVIHLKEAAAAPSKIHFLSETLKSVFRIKKLNQTEYDVAISGLFGYDPRLLFRNIRAKQHYQLLRNDVEKTGSYGKTKTYMAQYGGQFDAYIGVSQYTTDSFKRCYPQYADRAVTIYNVLADPPCRESMMQPEEYRQNDKFRILTVCRLSDRAKGLFRMVRVCKKLYEEFGDSFCWYIVGDGPDREELSRQITEQGLTQSMILCGESSNPFPYYRYADLVAVLSYYEGLCGVVNEAKIMERPVIATRFSGIDEQIINGYNGYIVENEETAILNQMRNILKEPKQLESLAINGMPEALLNNERKIRQYEELYQKICESK